MTTYAGSCQCGAIAFEVEGEITGLAECNCSRCRRVGALMWFVPREAFRLSTPEGQLGTYKFNKQVIEHHFCTTCGCAPFSYGVKPGGEKMVCVNVRCLPAFDWAGLPVQHFDGASL